MACCSCCTKKRTGIAFIVTAILLVVLTEVAYYELPKFIKKAVQKDLLMTPGAEGFKSWVDDAQPGSAPRYYNMYFFNVTNPNEIIAGEKPRLEQVGPFRYRQYVKNVNCTWSEDENVLTYYPWQWFSSLNDDSVPITTLNIPFKALLEALPYVDGGKYNVLEIATLMWLAGFDAKDTLFTTRSAHDLLFGYEWQVKLNETVAITVPFPGLSANQTDLAAVYAKGSSSMLTGKDNIANVRKQLTWKGQDKVYCCIRGIYPTGMGCSLGWSSPTANEFHGTEGRQFAPNISPGQPLDVFVDVIFRSAKITNLPGPNQWTSYKDIPMLHYTIAKNDLVNASVDSSNAGFNQFGPEGLINVTTCAEHIPTFLSKPHFLDAAASLQDAITFVNAPAGPPDAHRDIWDTYLDVEPITGKTMRAAERLQINMQVGPITDFSSLDSVRPNKFPVVWLEKIAALDHSQAKELHDDIFLPLKTVLYGRWAGVGLGCMLLVCGVLLIWWQHRDGRELDEERIPLAFTADDPATKRSAVYT